MTHVLLCMDTASFHKSSYLRTVNALCFRGYVKDQGLWVIKRRRNGQEGLRLGNRTGNSKTSLQRTHRTSIIAFTWSHFQSSSRDPFFSITKNYWLQELVINNSYIHNSLEISPHHEGKIIIIWQLFYGQLNIQSVICHVCACKSFVQDIALCYKTSWWFELFLIQQKSELNMY